MCSIIFLLLHHVLSVGLGELVVPISSPSALDAILRLAWDASAFVTSTNFSNNLSPFLCMDARDMDTVDRD